jgi:hypothetical protein
VPEIKLPKKDKDKNDNAKMIAAPVDGTLRRLREKDLVLQVGAKTLLKFRLLARTEFRNKNDQSIRDSLLKPGDQLSVLVNSEDEETAVRVVLVRSGNASERSTAELPFDEQSLRAPVAADLGKPKIITRDASSSNNASTEYETDKPAPTSEPAPTVEKIPAEPAPKPLPGTDGEFIAEVRSAAATYTSTLPNYSVDQVTNRYYSAGYPPRWQQIDSVTAELGYFDGKEHYSKIKVNGVEVSTPPERSGSWSMGEFSTTLEDLLSPSTDAQFRRRGDDRVAGRAAVVFNFTVAASSSHWRVIGPDGKAFSPSYEGAMWVDRDTRRVLRIEQRTQAFPADHPLARMEATLEYGVAQVDGHNYLLPASSEIMSCSRGSGTCTRNSIAFQNYRKFSTDSTIKYFTQRLF